MITGITQPIAGTPTTVSTMGFDNRTAGGLGVVRLVSPIVVNIAAIGQEAHFAASTLTFVPPGTFLTLGSGSLLLLVHGRRRWAESRGPS